MPLPKWSDDYLLNQPEIDEEHRRLFELLGLLEAALYQDTDLVMPTVSEVIGVLNNHVEEHFQHEEALMRSLPAMTDRDRDDHKKDHERWKSRLKEYIPLLTNAKTDLERRAHLAKTLLVGKRFWEEHFLHFDRKLEKYF